jgi:hypothetical protein
LAFTVEVKQIPQVLAKVPDGADRVVDREMRFMGRCWNQEHHLATAIEFTQEFLSIEQPRIGQLLRKAVHGVVQFIWDAFSSQGAEGAIGIPWLDMDSNHRPGWIMVPIE